MSGQVPTFWAAFRSWGMALLAADRQSTKESHDNGCSSTLYQVQAGPRWPALQVVPGWAWAAYLPEGHQGWRAYWPLAEMPRGPSSPEARATSCASEPSV